VKKGVSAFSIKYFGDLYDKIRRERRYFGQ